MWKFKKAIQFWNNALRKVRNSYAFKDFIKYKRAQAGVRKKKTIDSIVIV